MLDDNSEFVGRYLFDAQNGDGISIDMVLKAQSLEQLQQVALQHQMKKNLYAEWYDNYSDWYKT
jgi:hypothetical protein